MEHGIYSKYFSFILSHTWTWLCTKRTPNARKIIIYYHLLFFVTIPFDSEAQDRKKQK